jgi:hypothetical protein
MIGSEGPLPLLDTLRHFGYAGRSMVLLLVDCMKAWKPTVNVHEGRLATRDPRWRSDLRREHAEAGGVLAIPSHNHSLAGDFDAGQ